MEYANMSSIVPFKHLILPSTRLLIFCHIFNSFNLTAENALNRLNRRCALIRYVFHLDLDRKAEIKYDFDLQDTGMQLLTANESPSPGHFL